MTPRQRAVAALRGGVPDDQCPFFELGFYLTGDLLCSDFPTLEEQRRASPAERERLRQRALELTVSVAEHYQHSVICYWGPIPRLDFDDDLWYVSALRRAVGDRFLIAASADGTFAIPDGQNMEAMSALFMERPAEAHGEAARRLRDAIERVRRLVDAGVDLILMDSDYCFNAYRYPQVPETPDVGS